MPRKLYGVFAGVDWSSAKRSVSVYLEDGWYVAVDDRERSHRIPPALAKRGPDGMAEEVGKAFGQKGVTFKPALL